MPYLKTLLSLLTLCLLLVSCGDKPAAPTPQTAASIRTAELDNQGCHIRYTPVDDAIPLNEPTTIKLEASCNRETTVTVDTSKFDGHFQVSRTTEPPENQGAQPFQQQISIDIEPLADGDIALPEILVSFAFKDAPPVIIAIPGKTLHVAPPTEDELSENIDDSAATTPLDAIPPADHRLLYAAIAALLAIIGILAAIRYAKRHRKNAPAAVKQIPPHITALAQLGALLQQKLIEQGEYQLFYNRISEILRDYIRGRFHIDAPDRTTEEFLEELRHAPELFSKEHKLLLNNFLKHTDLVKYAGVIPCQDEIQSTVADTKSFIRETIPPEQP